MLPEWLHGFVGPRARRPYRRPAKPRFPRLRVEALEDRLAPAGLVAAYSFDAGAGSTVADASGNGNTGTLVNATWATAGKYGHALSFNGTNARVDIKDAASLHLTTAMTLEAWVNPSAVSSAWRDLVYKGNDNYYLMGTTDHSSLPGGGIIAGGTYAETFGTAILATNTWTHLATTYDGATLRLYVNGVQVSSVAKTGTILTSTNPLQLGGDSIYGQYFQGVIDEVRVYNGALTQAQIQTDMNTPLSTTPPTAPGSLAASAASVTQINLSWTASTSNIGVSGYLVERQDPGTNSFVQIGTTTGTTYNDTGLTPNSTYSYRVRAKDTAGNLSAYSNVASATTPQDTTPPTAPTNLAASAASSTQINLSWTASTDDIGAAGYLVERQNPGSSSFVQIGTATGTTYNDTGLTPSSTYSYRVRATDSDAASTLSAYSSVASATTQADTTPPTAPGNLAASAVSSNQINLSWTASTDDVGMAGYLVERQNPGSTSFVQVGTTTGTTYNDTGLSPNSTYSYRVRATDSDAAGTLSAYSNVASATTPATIPGLVAAYSFDAGTGSTVADASSNGHTGTLVNATWTTAGKYGNALSFNGTNARVDIPDAASLHLSTAMTLEAWVNPSAQSSAWRDLVYKGNDNYYLMATTDHSSLPGGGIITGGTHAETFGTTILATNTWTHLATTYDGATLRLYVNGVQVSSVAKTGNILTSTNPLQLGGDSIYGQYFQGVIDEVRVYNVALTAAQVQADLNTPISQDTQPPTAPTNLTATASGTTITLNWTASTDNVGVTGYLVERQDPGSTSFVQIGTTTTATTYNDSGLAANSTYSYRVRATDGSGNLSPYSNVAQATAQFGISPHMAMLTFAQTQQFTANSTGVSWAVDGVVGGSASSGTISSAGSYTAPTSIGSHTVTGTTADGMHSDSATVNVTSYPGTFTFHNDNLRSGANLNETVLTPANVNSTNFGKLFTYPLDGIAFASPLYVTHVSIPGAGYHNVVYVATEHDSVYAFDADGLSTTPLWQASFINPAAGVTPVPAADTGETVDIPNEIGITGTPVIDPASGTLYVVAKTKEVVGSTTNYVQRLHALDIGTGAEKFGGPVVIQASVPGTGTGSQGGQLPFVPLDENQRPALLLTNGVVYVGFASHGDIHPWHGWVLGYNATTLQQAMAYNVTPNAVGGGVWMSGDGPATDSTGSVYFVTGNGTFDANSGGVDYGDSVEKISPSGAVLDYFTPYNQATLDSADLDLGAGGVLLLPDQSGAHAHELVTAGKNGTIYLVDRDNMGHFNPNNDNQIVQSLVNIFPNGSPQPGNFSAPVYYNGYVYFSPIDGNIQAFQLSNGLLSTAPTSRSAGTYTYPGGTLAISANGNTNGILWAVQRNGTTAPGILFAYDPTNLANVLYNSSQTGSRDTMDIAAKFSIPLVANGKVFVGGTSQLTVYGLLPNPPLPMLALGGPAPRTGAGTLTPDQVRPLLAEAIVRWGAAGFDVSSLAKVPVQIADLPGGWLGMSDGTAIWIDVNAAGWDWYVDPTPRNDREFTTPGDQGEQGHMDLLTVLTHELGHVIGFGELDTGVMSEYLPTGTRLMPDLTVYGLLPISPDSLLARGGPATSISMGTLTSGQAQPVFAAATDRGSAPGLGVSKLINPMMPVADLVGGYRGTANGATVWMDVNAAGWDRSVEPAPWNDSGFTTPGNPAAHGFVDLLTVLDHGLDYVLGFDHRSEGVMADPLATDRRRTPAYDAFWGAMDTFRDKQQLEADTTERLRGSVMSALAPAKLEASDD